MYAEGLRRSFEMVKNLNLPIIVTENGVADDDDDMSRTYCIFVIISKAIKDGFIRGFYQLATDNFEWAEDTHVI